MNNSTRDWERTVLPVPHDLVETAATSDREIEEYLLDGFEAAFGKRPMAVDHSSFPDGRYVTLIVSGALANQYNVWAVRVGSRLRAAGVRLNVCVLTARDFGMVDPEHQEVFAASAIQRAGSVFTGCCP